MQPIVPVILAGGSGTRLWPFSREARPKQLLSLTSSRTLLQDTLTRVRGLGGGTADPFVVCNESHRIVVGEQVREIGIRAAGLVLEPAGRNTAPAVAIAAMAAAAVSSEADPLLLVLPADHVFQNVAAFGAAVAAAVEAAEAGKLVTFGIVPDRPETGYGYLLAGEPHGRWSLLERFVEKPDPATARQYVESGKYLWNSGMFMFSAAAYLRELERFAPDIYAASRAAYASASRDSEIVSLGAAFLDCRSDSIDYAVMEKTGDAAVVPLDAGWSDIGSWAALHELLEKDADGNVLRGDVLAHGCTNTYVHSSSRLVAAAGLDGIIIVETSDAVLVLAADRSQQVKQIVDALKAAGRDEVRVSAIDKAK